MGCGSKGIFSVSKPFPAMASLSSINIRFRVNLAELSTQMQSASREINRIGKDMQRVGDSMSMYITAPLLALGGASLKSGADMESLSRGLESVMGSAGAASAELVKLKEVAKLPGLGLEEAVRGSVNLQAAGFSADEARKTLMAFGNALATVGKGKRELDLVTLALTQMNNKASGFGQDLRQLTEQLPQLRGALTKAFGTADSEAISKMGVSGKQVVQVLTAEFAKLPKVTGGLNNAFENASDNAKIALADLGQTINKTFDIEGVLNKASVAVQGAAESFATLDPEIQRVVLTMGAMAAAAGPAISVGGRIAQSFSAITTGGVVTGVIALAAGIALATSRLTPLTNASEEFDKVLQGATQSIAKEKAELDQNIAIAKNSNIERGERIKAIQNINALSPEYLGNLTLENINTKEATKAINDYNASLIKRAQLTAAQEKLVEVSKKLLDLQMGQNDAVKPSLWQDLANSFKAAGNAQMQAVYAAQTMAGNFVEEKTNLEALQKSLQGFIAENSDFVDSQNANSEATAGTIEYYQQQIEKLEKLSKATGVTKDQLAKYNAQIEDFRLKILALRGLKSEAAFGTIDWYNEKIKALEKLRDSSLTTRDAIEVLEKQITKLETKRDALLGKRPEVKSVTATLDVQSPGLNDSASAQRVKFMEAEKSRLQDLQKAYAGSDAEFKRIQDLIDGYDFNIKLEMDPSSVITATEKIIPAFDELAYKQEQLRSMAVMIAEGAASAFEGMANRWLDSLDLANDGLQGFFKGLASVVIKIISAMLAQSIAQSIAGATAAAAATGPAAIFTQPAFMAEMIAGVFAAFAAIPKFETGGIVGGSSFVGDRLFARVNSGEMILNRRQQERIHSMINPAPTGSDLMGQLEGMFKLQGDDLVLSIERTMKKQKRNR